MDNISKAKAWVSGFMSVLTLVLAVLADNVLNLNEIGQIIAAVIGFAVSAYVVWRTPYFKKENTNV